MHTIKAWIFPSRGPVISRYQGHRYACDAGRNFEKRLPGQARKQTSESCLHGASRDNPSRSEFRGSQLSATEELMYRMSLYRVSNVNVGKSAVITTT